MSTTKTTKNYSEISVDLANTIVDLSNEHHKLTSKFLKFAGPVTVSRALLYAFMTGANSHQINEVQFAAGINRFGVENPMPTVKRRIALYGNSEEVKNLIE
jgi:hypothetical protein